jgi:hypothetical protein
VARNCYRDYQALQRFAGSHPKWVYAVAFGFIIDDVRTTDRKELEDELVEQSDEDELIDDNQYLNLNENDGEAFERPGCGQFADFVPLEDVWNEDSAYLEMLAKEVRETTRFP